MVSMGSLAGRSAEDILGEVLWRRLPQGDEAGSVASFSDLPPFELRQLDQWKILEMLTDCDAPVWALEILRDYGQNWAESASDSNIRICGSILEYAAIAAALLAHGRKITTHSYLHVAEQCRRMRQYRWLPSQLVNLFEQVAFYCRPRIEAKVA